MKTVQHSIANLILNLKKKYRFDKKYRFQKKINHNSVTFFSFLAQKLRFFLSRQKLKHTYFEIFGIVKNFKFKNRQNLFMMNLFFLKSPHQCPKHCRRHQIEQKIPQKVTDFRTFKYHFCSCQICMEPCMGQPMTQNGFYGRRPTKFEPNKTKSERTIS